MSRGAGTTTRVALAPALFMFLLIVAITPSTSATHVLGQDKPPGVDAANFTALYGQLGVDSATAGTGITRGTAATLPPGTYVVRIGGSCLNSGITEHDFALYHQNTLMLWLEYIIGTSSYVEAGQDASITDYGVAYAALTHGNPATTEWVVWFTTSATMTATAIVSHDGCSASPDNRRQWTSTSTAGTCEATVGYIGKSQAAGVYNACYLDATETMTPAAPTNLAATSSNHSTTLTWNAVADATSYKVYMSADDVTYSLWSSPVAGTTFTESGLTNGVRYYWKVSAVNANGEGDKSTRVLSLPRDTPNVALTQDPAGGVDVSWGIVESNVANFIVNRSTTNWTSWATIATTAANVYEFDDDTCTERTTYYYRVVSILTTGEYGPESSVKHLLCPDVTNPAAPAGLTADPFQFEVVLKWTANGEVDFANYKVYRDDVLVGSPTATAWADQNVTDTQLHVWAVRAIDTTGNEGAASRVTSALLPATQSGGGGGGAGGESGGSSGVGGFTGGGSSSSVAAGSPLDQARARVADLVDEFPKFTSAEWIAIVIALVLLILSFPEVRAVAGLPIPPASSTVMVGLAVVLLALVWWSP